MTAHRSCRLLAVAVAVALSLGACSGDEATPATTTAPTTATTAPPSTSEPPGVPIDPAVLGTGDCFEERVLSGQGQTEFEESQTVEVDCEDPHRNEIYLVTAMPEEAGSEFPGEEAVAEFADDACLTAFESFVGLAYVESIWEIGYVVPTEESWPLPDRRVVCFVFNRDGDKVSGSAQDTAQ
jgi:hypothetical protein